MKKRLILLMMLLCLSISASAEEAVSEAVTAEQPEEAVSEAVTAEEPESAAGFTEKMVTVITDGEEAGELPLRFYEATPNVP